MLKKIYCPNRETLVLFFTDREPFILSSPEGALNLYRWLYNENTVLPLNEHSRALIASLEDTTETEITCITSKAV